MKTIYLILILLSTGLYFVSCSKEVDFDGQLPPSKITLNCFAEPDSFIVANISSSWNISQNINGYGYSNWGVPESRSGLMKDAQVTLYINGEFRENMQPTDPLVTYPSHMSQTKAKEGDIIKIIVKKSGYPDAYSETVVPGKSLILSVDTIRFDDQYSPNSMRFLIRFKDLDAGKKNYYRLILEKSISRNGVISNRSSVSFDYDLDPALRDGYFDVMDEMMATTTKNIYGIFNDESFDGKEYTLNVSIHPAYSYKYETGYKEIIEEISIYQVKLVTLSESAYLYMKSRTYYDYNGDGDPFIEPETIFTNIYGGLGIMGAFQKDIVTIQMPFVETTPWHYYPDY